MSCVDIDILFRTYLEMLINVNYSDMFELFCLIAFNLKLEAFTKKIKIFRRIRKGQLLRYKSMNY